MLVEKKKIEYSDCDFSGRMSLICFYQVCENTISSYLERFGLDNFSMASKFNSMWVFVKNRTLINNFPKWHDEIEIHTYIVQKTNLKLFLKTDLIDSNNDVLASCVIESVPLKKDSFKLCRLSFFGADTLLVENEEEQVFEKIDDQNLEFVKTLKVTSDLIDYSHHVNNVEYFRLINGTMSLEELGKLNLKEVNIVYLGQSMEKDELTIYSNPTKDNFLITNNGKDVLRVKFN